MKKDLTIIIPVYNTPFDLVKRCLLSIKIPNFVSYEVLLIDDGSENNLSVLYDQLISDTIKVIHKENTGVSNTRNIGIDLSEGRYILFIDSDDELISDNVEWELLAKDYDLIFYDYSIINNMNSIDFNEIEKSDSCIVESIDLIFNFIKSDKFYSPFSKFIKRDFLSQHYIKFNENMINGEDAIFNLDILCSNPLIYYVKKSIYKYYYTTINYNNRVKSKFNRTVEDYLLKYERKIDLISKEEMDYELVSLVYNKCVEQLFRIAMICCMVNLTKKDELFYYLKQANIKKNNLSFVNKIKFRLLKNKNWFIISFFSFLRKYYLKLKKF